MNFGDAIKELKLGKRLQRTGWNGKGLFIYLVPAASYPVQTGAAKEHFGEGAMVPYAAYLALKNVDETVSTWAPSINDTLAEDWQVVGCTVPPHQQRVLVLQVGDLLDHAQVRLTLVLGDRDQHLAGDVHAHVSHGGTEGHGAPRPARTASR